MNLPTLIFITVALLVLFVLSRRKKRTAAQRTDSIELLFGENKTMANGSTPIGTPVLVTIVPLEGDGVTPSGGTVSLANWSSSNPNLATFGLTSAASTTWTPTGAVGTSDLSVTCTVTDLDGTIVANLTGTGTLTVTAGAGDARTVSINLTFTPVA